MSPDRRDSDRRPPAGFIRHALRVALTGVAFTGFFFGAALLGSVVLQLLRLWPGSLMERQRRCQRLVRAAWVLFHDYLRWVGLVDFDRRRYDLDVRAPSIVIANHPTLIDITALIAVGSPGEGMASAVDQAEARLRAGHLVILFPEGTRSPVGGLGRFRLGAFELARRTGVPILPVRITAEPPALWKGLAWYAIPRQTVNFRLQPLPPVSVDPSATMAELHDITAMTKAALAGRAEERRNRRS